MDGLKPEAMEEKAREQFMQTFQSDTVTLLDGRVHIAKTGKEYQPMVYWATVGPWYFDPKWFDDLEKAKPYAWCCFQACVLREAVEGEKEQPADKSRPKDAKAMKGKAGKAFVDKVGRDSEMGRLELTLPNGRVEINNTGNGYHQPIVHLAGWSIPASFQSLRYTLEEAKEYAWRCFQACVLYKAISGPELPQGSLGL
jgi:hypothetical protein